MPIYIVYYGNITDKSKSTHIDTAIGKHEAAFNAYMGKNVTNKKKLTPVSIDEETNTEILNPKSKNVGAYYQLTEFDAEKFIADIKHPNSKDVKEFITGQNSANHSDLYALITETESHIISDNKQELTNLANMYDEHFKKSKKGKKRSRNSSSSVASSSAAASLSTTLPNFNSPMFQAWAKEGDLANINFNSPMFQAWAKEGDLANIGKKTTGFGKSKKRKSKKRKSKKRKSKKRKSKIKPHKRTSKR